MRAAKSCGRCNKLPALQDHIVVVSGLACPGLRRIVANARAVLMPSLAEGFGLPVIEALAIGTPVLASDLPAHRSERRGGGAAVHRVGGGAGDVPQVRADGAELRGGPADGRDRAAGQRGPPPGPGGREVGAGAVREGPRPLRQGLARVGAARADGPADQRRGPDAALVYRGRVGPVR